MPQAWLYESYGKGPGTDANCVISTQSKKCKMICKDECAKVCEAIDECPPPPPLGPAPEPPPPYASAKLIFSRAGGYNFPDPTDAGVSVRRDECAPPSKVGEGVRRAGRSTAQT